MKKVCAAVLCLAIALSLGACAPAESAVSPAASFTPEPTATPIPSPSPTPGPNPTAAPRPLAEELTENAVFSDSIGGYMPNLLDGDSETFITYKYGDRFFIQSEEPVGILYICWFRLPPASVTATVNGGSFPIGDQGYLYEYIELPQTTNLITLTFNSRTDVSDIRVFTEGVAPSDVQIWEPPLEKADVLVFPAHSDDDVIFFGPLIAQCVDRGCSVQLCFMVEHDDLWFDWKTRTQELLCGMWEMGVHNYPVIGPFPDYVDTLYSLDNALEQYNLERVIQFAVEQIRRFEPLVVVGHDRYGEYGHGAHQLYALALEYAVAVAEDDSIFVRSANAWGAWETPKFYLHMANENRLTLDVETPLDSFGGRTAFEVACDAMEHHKSQLQYPHRPTLESEKFPRYDCRIFGLVRSYVGADTGNDILENVTPYEAR